MPVDRLERRVEALLGLAVQLTDRAAQFGHRLFHVAALGVECFELLGHRRQLVIGSEIDATKPVAIGFELGELPLHLDECRQFGIRFDPGERKTAFRNDAERLADAPHLSAAAFARRFQLRFDACTGLARVGNLALQGPERLARIVQCRFPFRQQVGRPAALFFREPDRIEQARAPCL